MKRLLRFSVPSAFLGIVLAVFPAKPAMAQSDSGRSVAGDTVLAPMAADMQEIMNLIRSDYYKKIDLRECWVKILKNGLSECLDPYSYYMTRRDFDAFNAPYLDSTYVGTGFYLIRRAGLTLMLPMTREVAVETGVRRGDVLVYVNDTNMTRFDPERISKMFKIQPNTTMTIKVRRGGRLIGPLTLTRRLRPKPVVVAERLDSLTAYVFFSIFSDRAIDELENALDTLYERGVRGIVLDIRVNGGGRLNSMMGIIGLFAPRGELLALSAVNHNTGYREQYSSIDAGPFSNLALVVLQSRSSASASELFAATLKAWGRAPIVGDTSYGKGVAQEVRPLQSGNVLRLTILEFFAGDQRTPINGVGVPPDYFVRDVEPKRNEIFVDRELMKAIEVLRALIKQ